MKADVFVGRETELADVSALLERVRHVTLTGPAGVGKTGVARRLAVALEPAFPGGVHVVELADAPTDVDSLTEMLARAAGARTRPGVTALRSLIDVLAPRRSLIILDTCDRVVGAAGILVGMLLRSVEELRVLTTSRQRLGLPGEHLYPVGGLPDDEAVRLFAALTRGGETGDTDPAELCRRLDNLPLAIELAAGAAPRRAAGPRRHSSMRVAIGWSHELCTPVERLLWARASVFAGTFDLEAAEEVCAGGALGAGQVLDGLLGLLDKSVLAREEGEGGVRYRLLNTVREFGLVWLDRLGETDEIRRRHRDHYLALSARAEMSWQGRQLEWYRRLVLECGNMRGAIEYCYSRPEEYRKGLDLVGNLWFLWACCGMQAPGDDLLQRGLDLDHSVSPERVKALWVHAWVSIQRGDLERAERILTECAAEDEDGYATAYVSQFQAHLAVVRGDVGEALRLIKHARVRHRSTGNVFPGFLPTYTVVATAMMLAGHHTQAVSVLREGRELCESCGDYWTLIRLDLLLAQAELLLGNTASAAASARGSLRGARLFGDTISLMEALEVFVVIAESCSDDAFAATLFGASRAAWESAGVPPSRSPIVTSMLRVIELRLRGRMGRTEFERLAEEGSSTGLRAAVEHALQGALS
ncbi:putative ATPase [Streptosporangium becharense]|uniref:Putative ATPase n=1 Tax=Streptosporangium becharense TaxID=1816182 RepID=A0A7W9IFK9_9ACTN|nr:AAA family ATPase [Streptosporangium becharense]MBB2909412.1 putative ATPase [Streptosporangium becharense]MBB5819631.1 putative ATPase [Streptosporangium becharense]